jgi:HD superfamily phosphohydrolase
MDRKHFVTDPIHGNIEIPHWLMQIKDELPIRRMNNIKQLGLKALVDFPGAIHTRYLHSLGTMYLAGKLADLLIQKEETKGRTDLKKNLINNKKCLQAAGFFHDIGHGPFSHVIDFVMKTALKTDHEKMGVKIVKENFKDVLEEESIPVDSVCKIITAKHKYPFLGDIINNSMDVDKVDYLIRDSYFVGLRYSFDLDHFLNQVTICGAGNTLEEYKLVLENTKEAKSSIQLFLLIWKTMYDLVYHVSASRTAEKMLEKAILEALKIDKGLGTKMSNAKEFITIDEYNLLDQVSKAGEFSKKLVEMIKKNNLYSELWSDELKEPNLSLNPRFMESLRSVDNASEKITQELCKARPEPYTLICDIIRTKAPRNILVDKLDKDGEPIQMESSIIEALKKEELTIKVYIEPILNKKKGKSLAKTIKKDVQRIIEEWKG